MGPPFVISLFFIFPCNPNRESLKVVEHYFPKYALQEQDILGSKESADKVLAIVPEDILYNILFFSLCQTHQHTKCCHRFVPN